jgi:hypothetical protein
LSRYVSRIILGRTGDTPPTQAGERISGLGGGCGLGVMPMKASR